MIHPIASVQRCFPERIEAVVLDWAGTTVDFGSRAPIAAILQTMEAIGFPVTEAEARQPMGRAKRDHLDCMLQQQPVRKRWIEQYGTEPVDADIDRIYRRFVDVQTECVADLSAVIPGCLEAIAWCRTQQIGVGSTTGYTRPLLELVAARAAREGYQPDNQICADDVSPGRPAPWMLLRSARLLGVTHVTAIVKVDDTPAGVRAARNAGAWSVGVVESGNEVGMSKTDLDALPFEERVSLLHAATDRLTRAGAHLLIDTIADLPQAIELIRERMRQGASPQ